MELLSKMFLELFNISRDFRPASSRSNKNMATVEARKFRPTRVVERAHGNRLYGRHGFQREADIGAASSTEILVQPST